MKDNTRGQNIAAAIKVEAEKKQCLENARRRDARMTLRATEEAKTTTETKSTVKGERSKARPNSAEGAKSKQLCLLIAPDMHEMIKTRALCEGITVNEYIRRLIEEDLKNELC